MDEYLDDAIDEACANCLRDILDGLGAHIPDTYDDIYDFGYTNGVIPEMREAVLRGVAECNGKM